MMKNFYRSFYEFHPIVRSLLLGTILARGAASMSMPFLALFLSLQLHISPGVIGLIIGAGSLAGTFGGFVGGALSDRFGRKTIMLSALYIWGFAFFGFGMAKSAGVLLLLNILNGLCRSFFEPVSQALMADLTDSDKRLRVFSVRYFAINVGVAVGPMVGALLGLAAGSVPFIVTGIIYLLYAFSLHVLLVKFGVHRIKGGSKETVMLRSAFGVVRRDRLFRLFLAGGIVASFGYSQMTTNLSQHVESLIPSGVGVFALLMTVNAVTVVLVQLPLGKWSEKRSPVSVIAAGNILFALGNLGFAYSSTAAAFIVSMILFTLGEILNFPAGNLLIDRLSPEGMRGTYFGAQSFSSLGRFLGPWLGGLMLSHYGGRTMFIVVAITTLLGTLFYMRGRRLDETGRMAGKPATASKAAAG